MYIEFEFFLIPETDQNIILTDGYKFDYLSLNRLFITEE